MTPASATDAQDISAEVTSLISVLHATDQRLEELLAGEVDSVADRDGRTILLRRAQEHLRESEAAKQAAILDALPAQVAVLDSRGHITSVNEAWRRFACTQVLREANYGIGTNYLDVCDRAVGGNASEPGDAAAGIRSVLAGTADSFSIEYPCHSTPEPGWFLMSVTSLATHQPSGAIVMHVDVSVRKRAEDAVQRSQENLRHLIDGLGPSMFVALLTPQGIVLEVNRSPLAAAGLKPEDVVGKPFAETHWWSHSPQVQSQLREAIVRAAHGECSRYEVRTRGASDFIDFDFSLQPLRDEAGEVIFLIPSAIDITERKRAETALQESEAEFRAMTELMPQIVWITDPDGLCTHVNQHWTEYTGRAFEDSLGSGWGASLHPEDRSQAQMAWQHATATATPFSNQTRMQRADGAYRWWLIRGVPQRDPGGKVLKWLGTCTDIDDLKLAQQEVTCTNRSLRRQRTELRVLFDLVPAMIGFKDTEDRILLVNRHLAEAAGLSVEQIEGRPAIEIYPNEAAGFREADLEVIRTGVPKLGIIETVRDGAGNVRWLQTDKVPYRDDNGKVIGIVVMAQDITERKADQDALREMNAELEARVHARTAEADQARDEAEHASRAKSAFLAAMSHEIRTPMNGVIGMIEVLHQTSLKGYQVEMIDLIRDSAFSLLQIVDDILDFSKIEAGMLNVESAPMQLAGMVERACSMLDHLAVSQNVRMTVFVDPALPWMVSGDEGRLRQVLVNLTGNAIKFSSRIDRPGRVSVRVVAVASRPEGASVDIIVTDNGIGMDEATLSQLYKPFSQADISTTRRFGGTGLGLAITDMLVRLMGGRISVASTLGEGATFTVRLDFAVLDETTDAERRPLLLDSIRCRIVGEERPLGDDIAACLSQAGMLVDRSAGLPQAREAQRAAGLGLWLMLPGEKAPTLAELRAWAPDAPDVQTRFIVLGWGKRRRPRAASADLVEVDANTLVRRTLFRALALAAGHAIEDEVEEHGQVAPSLWRAPPWQEARAQGRLILVVEDNATNRIVILRQLDLIGFRAEVAEDGIEALDRWRTGEYALVLTDLHMPRMDGYSLAAAIRAEESPQRHTPIIALTANALRDEELRCQEAGIDGHLSKPIRLAQLKLAIEGWLGPAFPQPTVLRGAEDPVVATHPPVDLGVLVALVGADPEVLDEVLCAFRASAAQCSAELGQGAVAGSMQAVTEAAHKLKSAARSIGAARLAEICADIEQVASSQRLSGLSTKLALFDAELAAVDAYILSR